MKGVDTLPVVLQTEWKTESNRTPLYLYYRYFDSHCTLSRQGHSYIHNLEDNKVFSPNRVVELLINEFTSSLFR